MSDRILKIRRGSIVKGLLPKALTLGHAHRRNELGALVGEAWYLDAGGVGFIHFTDEAGRDLSGDEALLACDSFAADHGYEESKDGTMEYRAKGG